MTNEQRCEICDLTDDEIRGLHRIAKEIGDAQVMTLCEIALGDIGITRNIARAALKGAKQDRCHDMRCQKDRGHAGSHASRSWDASRSDERIEEWSNNTEVTP